MSRAGAKKDGERVKRGKRHHEDFELGLGEGWTDSSEGETDVPSTSPTVKSPKRLCQVSRSGVIPRAALDPRPAVLTTKIGLVFLDEQSLVSLGKKVVPKNTATMTKWAVNNFQKWIASRNKRFVDDESNQVHMDILATVDSSGFGITQRRHERLMVLDIRHILCLLVFCGTCVL